MQTVIFDVKTVPSLYVDNNEPRGGGAVTFYCYSYIWLFKNRLKPLLSVYFLP
eukprot:UN02162